MVLSPLLENVDERYWIIVPRYGASHVRSEFPIQLSVGSADDREDVALAEDQELLALDRDFGAAVLPVLHLVANLDVHRNALVLLESAGSDGDDLALLRLLLRCVGDIQPTAHLFALLERSNDDAVGQWADLRTGLGGHTVCFSLCLR